jgi:hypothetical protein
MLKNLDTDGVPFAEGGSTSTGLNYLVGEDDTNSRVPYAAGGRRGFLKILAGLGAAGAAFKTGLLSLKGAAKPAAKVAKEAATGGAPPHFFKLVAKIKALGDDVTETAALAERQNVKKYKDFELTEDVVTGRQEVIRYKQSEEATYYGQQLTEETYMSYTPGEQIFQETAKGKTKIIKTQPDYEEGTAFVRNDRGYTGEIVDESNTIADDIFEEVGEKIPEIIRKGKAGGGRMGYAGGKKVVEGLISLLNKKAGKDVLTTANKIKTPQKTLDREMFKNTNERLNLKKQMTDEDYEDFLEYDLHDVDIEGYNFDGTYGDAQRILKEKKAYEADMFAQYKSEGGSKRLGGPKDPMADAIDNASPGYTGDLKYDAQLVADDLAEKMYGVEYDDLTQAQQMDLYDKAYTALSKNEQGFKQMQNLSKPEKTLKSMKEGKGIDISDPDVADEFSRFMKESDPKGYKDIEEKILLESFDPKKTKGNAEGGRIGLLSGGGVLKKLIMNLAKEKKMKPSEVLKIMNYKSLPSKIKNLMTKEEFTKMKDQRLEGVEIWKDLMYSQQEMTKNIDAGKNTPAAELFEMLEKTSPGYGTVPRNISDADMLQMEQMIKNMKTKDNRQLNATGGLANLLGE